MGCSPALSGMRASARLMATRSMVTQARPPAWPTLSTTSGWWACHVKFSTPSGLAMSVTRAKQFFMEKWLPGSGYALRDGVESMELYDQRSNIQLPSIELMFPLQKNED